MAEPMTEEQYEILRKEKEEEGRELDESIVSRYHSWEEYSSVDDEGRRKMIAESWEQYKCEEDDLYRFEMVRAMRDNDWRMKAIPPSHRNSRG